MKHLRALQLLFLATLSAVALGQVKQPLPFDGRIEADRPETYDGTLVGTVLGPARVRSFPGASRSPVLLAVQPVRVQDSRAFAAGSVVDVYLPIDVYLPDEGRMFRPSLAGVPGSGDPTDLASGPWGALPVGGRVLVLATKPTESGVLRVPGQRGYPDQRFALSPSDPPGAFAFAFFDTRREGLASVADPTWRALTSVAEALPGSSDTNARRVGNFLEALGSPKLLPADGALRTDNRLSRLFADAARGESAYHRALIDLALNSLDYVGYGDRFYRDLYASATDPGAFPNGVRGPSYWEQPENLEMGVPKGFRHDAPPGAGEWTAMIEGARSPTVAAWLLKGLATKPSDADVRSMARFLDSPDPRLRHAFVERLAAWDRFSPPAEPTEVRGEGGRFHTEYPGLDADVARWKAKLGTP